MLKNMQTGRAAPGFVYKGEAASYIYSYLFLQKKTYLKSIIPAYIKMTHNTVAVWFHIFTCIHLFIHISWCVCQASPEKMELEAGDYQGFGPPCI